MTAETKKTAETLIALEREGHTPIRGADLEKMGFKPVPQKDGTIQEFYRNEVSGHYYWYAEGDMMRIAKTEKEFRADTRVVKGKVQ